MKKVAIYIISDGIGGAEKVVGQILSSLEDNCNIYLITNNEIATYYSEVFPVERTLNVGNIYLHRNKKFQIVRYLINNRFYSIKRLVVKSKSRKVIKYISLNYIEHINPHLEFALYSSLICKKVNKKLYLTYHVHGAFGLISKKVLKTEIPKSKIDFSSIDMLIFVSKYIYHLYLEKNIHINNFEIIYNGIDPKQFEMEREQRKECFTILYVGGDKYIKGYDLMIDTVEQIANIYKEKFVVIVLGNLSPNSTLIKRINERSLQNLFEIVGFVKDPAHLEYFKKADVLFFPSRSEVLGVAALEAVFADLPVVASNVGGIPEIIENEENGILCSINPIEFANSLISLMNNKTNYKLKTQTYNAQNKIKFYMSTMIEKVKNIYSN